MSLFAVTRCQGPQWAPRLPLDGQRGWEAHAAYMTGLHEQGVVLVGGPLERTREVLLIVCAEDEHEVMRVLADDPWTQDELLVTERIVPWTLRLGALPQR